MRHKAPRAPGPRIVGALLLILGSACGTKSSGSAPDAGVDAEIPITSAEPLPPPPASAEEEPPPLPEPHRACPPEMVLVAKSFCVDRWEATLVDKNTGTPLSPYYPPMRKLAIRLASEWERERFRVGGPKAQLLGVPPLSAWQHANDPVPMAISRPGVTPSGYVSGVIADDACKNAGKRLCKPDEWITACEGSAHRQFPYGDTYVPGSCNIFRNKHPAAELHDDASSGHLDPRLNLVTEGNSPLLRKTGATTTCGSQWDDDVIWDMNGNIDEWVDDDKGRFAGGFFSRSKKDGCLSKVTAHGKTYFDYSTGVRCCADPAP